MKKKAGGENDAYQPLAGFARQSLTKGYARAALTLAAF
jgi:hypothetical protein